MSIQNDLIEFSQAYDAKQSREGLALLCIMATGGAMSISGLGVVPGASGRLAGTYHPYSMDELWKFVEPGVRKFKPGFRQEDWRSVHSDSSLYYLEALKIRHPGNYLYVASTAALETTRRRKGENVSYVAIERPGGDQTLWKILFKKKEDKHADLGLHGSPDDVWKAIFCNADGSVNLRLLAAQRLDEDERTTLAILAIILDDKSFAFLVPGDQIIQLAAGANAMETVWAQV